MSREKHASCDVPEEVIAAYDQFVAASDFTPALNSFYKLCEVLDINPKNHKTVFSLMKSKLTLWKCQTLFSKLEKKGKHQDYSNQDHSKPCAKLKVLVIGAGPVGLRTAIEAAYLGANVMVVEKRDSFSRNNVLHLWPFLISDLKALGVKSFFGKFCAGTLDHISIRRLQCILLKVGLLLGVQFHTRTMIEGIVECTGDKGWRGNFKPVTSPLNSVDFDAIVGCDGSKANCLKFKRKEFRGKLAIAITCNFVNKKTSEEARVEEISGVAFIYNQEFFHELNKKTGIELENIVYYKDETHYFVMTAKKRSLLAKGVIKQDSKDVFKLLSSDNINHKKLCDFSRESADFATKYQLPHHEFAVNHYGKEDVALFDFTSIHQAECASKIIERRGKKLLLCIAGDLLLEPFWPTGSGCARGFLGAMDASWMIRRYGMEHNPIDIIQERESIFTLLPQTTPETLMANHDKYSINPSTRYCNLNVHVVTKAQAKNYYDCSSTPVLLNEVCLPKESTDLSKPIIKKQEEAEHNILLQWCQEQTADYSNVDIIDFSTSWKNGLAFCAIINHFRPDLIDYASLNSNDIELNCRRAFSVAEEQFGIPPKMSAHDFANRRYPDTLTIVAYVSLYYEALKNETPAKIKMELSGNVDDSLTGFGDNNWTNFTSKMSIISRLTRNNKKKKRKSNKSNKEKENDMLASSEEVNVSSECSTTIDNKAARKPDLTNDVLEKPPPKPPRRILVETNTGVNELEPGKNKISMLAEAVFGDTTVQMGNQYPPRKDSKSEILGESEKCHFCQRKVFVIERQSAEGYFFHRTCFRCFLCKCQLLLGNYAFHVDDDDNGKFYCKLHYNRVIYEIEKKDAIKTEKKRPFSTVTNVEQRTAGSETGPKISQNRPRLATTGAVDKDQEKNVTKPVRPVKSRVSDLQTMLEENTSSAKRLGNKTPYDKLSSKQFNRHPSLLRCGARKVSTGSFLTSSKLSVSTPNLAKLIQEDPLFEKEREEHKIVDDFVPLSKRDVTTEDNYGAVNRRPIDERRAQYPVSMAFTDRVGELKSISVDIELNDSQCDTSGSSPKETEKKKKKNPFIKKKKKLVPSKELLDDLNADSTPEASSGESGVILPPPYSTQAKEAVDVIKPALPMTIPETHADGPEMETSNLKKINVYTSHNMKFDSLPPLELDEELSSSDEETMASPVTNKKKLGKKDKKKMEKILEAKEKARADKRIKKEMKAREVKRLWQAQSIQRKLQEVDVKQYELEFKAKRLENELKNENNSQETRNRLTYEWISLVNEKNTLLRFESEFVIESNSIQLEDRQARLDQEIRGLLTCSDPKRNSKKEIDRLTAELVDTVEQRNALIEMLEEDRKRELEEDSYLNVTFSLKAHELGFDRCI